jgi:hypothetical protein
MEENSGIPGGTFRSASRLVRLNNAPPPSIGKHFFLHIKKSCQLFSFFVAVVVVVVLAAVVVLRQLPVCDFTSTT